jgi:hypothetical protein
MRQQVISADAQQPEREDANNDGPIQLVGIYLDESTIRASRHG